MTDNQQLDERIGRITRTPFRSRFHLRDSDVDYIAARDMDTMKRHAEDFIAARLAPRNPPRDGKQTPWKGHPVFLAQHATATCCRTCLQSSHGITAGHALTAAEQSEVVAVICRWIELELAAAPGRRTAPAPPTAVPRRSRRAVMQPALF